MTFTSHLLHVVCSGNIIFWLEYYVALKSTGEIGEYYKIIVMIFLSNIFILEKVSLLVYTGIITAFFFFLIIYMYSGQLLKNGYYAKYISTSPRYFGSVQHVVHTFFHFFHSSLLNIILPQTFFSFMSFFSKSIPKNNIMR